MEPQQRLIRHPGLQPLWDSLDRDRNQQQLAAVVLLLIGLALIVLTLRGGFLWPFLGGLTATGGLYWLFRLLSEQPVAAWREQLRASPDSIVWVYGLMTERMPFGLNLLRSATLYLVDADGEAHAFALRPQELKLVTKTLNRLLPAAEFGYTEARELKYRGEVTRFRAGRNFDGEW